MDTISIKKYEFWIFLAVVLAMACFGLAQASASTLEQTNMATSTFVSQWIQTLNYTCPLLDNACTSGSELTSSSLTGDISSITIHPTVGGGSANRVSIILSEIGTGAVRDSGFLSLNGNDITYSFAPFTFSPNKYYNINGEFVDAGNFLTPGSLWGAPTSTNNYVPGELENGLPAQLSDMYMITDAQAPLTQDTIEITYPTASSSPPLLFPTYKVNWTSGTSTSATSGDYYFINIYVSATSSPLADPGKILDGSLLVDDSLSHTNLEIPRDYLTHPTQMWYAQAELRYKPVNETLSQQVAVSPVVGFSQSAGGATGYWGTVPNVTTGTLPFIQAISSCSTGETPASSTWEIVSCNVSNFFYSLWNSIVNFVVNIMNTLKNLILGIFPVNVFTHLNSDILAAQNAPERYSAPVMDLQFGSYNLVFLSSSTIDQAKTKIGFDFRQFFDYLMYALTGVLMIIIGGLTFVHFKKKHGKQK